MYLAIHPLWLKYALRCAPFFIVDWCTFVAAHAVSCSGTQRLYFAIPILKRNHGRYINMSSVQNVRVDHTVCLHYVEDPRAGGPIGVEVVDSTQGTFPERLILRGQHVRLEPLESDVHAKSIYESTHAGGVGESIFAYLSYGPFPSYEEFASYLRGQEILQDPLYFAVIDIKTERAIGFTSFLRIRPAMRSIEIGHVCYGAPLQRTTGATEAHYLLMRYAPVARYAFDEIRYRRVEWKCNALNKKSWQAAKRLGFQFEGIFRQDMISKGRNRDTAWFSILDSEWDQYLREGYGKWLQPKNFAADGQQIAKLEECIKAPGSSHP